MGNARAVGGTLNRATGALFGPMTVNGLKSLQEIGNVMIGIDSIDQNGNLGIVNEFETEQKKIMLEKARTVLIPITRSKLGRAVSYPIGNVSDLKKNKKLLVFVCGEPSVDNEMINKLSSILDQENLIFTRPRENEKTPLTS